MSPRVLADVITRTVIDKTSVASEHHRQNTSHALRTTRGQTRS